MDENVAQSQTMAEVVSEVAKAVASEMNGKNIAVSLITTIAGTALLNAIAVPLGFSGGVIRRWKSAKPNDLEKHFNNALYGIFEADESNTPEVVLAKMEAKRALEQGLAMSPS